MSYKITRVGCRWAVESKLVSGASVFVRYGSWEKACCAYLGLTGTDLEQCRLLQEFNFSDREKYRISVRSMNMHSLEVLYGQG